MFPRRDRLSRATLGRPGGTRTLSGPHMSIRIPQNGHGYAVIISKKTLYRSVDRHRLKRRVAAALRRPPPLPLPKALVIYPKASTLGLPPRELRAELAALITKVLRRGKMQDT